VTAGLKGRVKSNKEGRSFLGGNFIPITLAKNSPAVNAKLTLSDAVLDPQSGPALEWNQCIQTKSERGLKNYGGITP
jgi:hypothetical protein